MFLRLLITTEQQHHAPLRECLRKVNKHTVDIVQVHSSVHDIADLVALHRPDIVILDPSLDNASMLREWSQRYGVTPVLICVCKHDEYAVDAFNAGAAHYLTAPLLPEHVENALQRAVARIIRYDREGGNGTSAHESRAPFQCRVIALPSMSGIEIRNHDDLLAAHGDGNYTRVILKEEQSMLLSRTLKDVEPSLTQAGLMRVHRSHMINPGQVRRVKRGKTPIVELSNGDVVDVSDRYKDMLFAMLQITSRKR